MFEFYKTRCNQGIRLPESAALAVTGNQLLDPPMERRRHRPLQAREPFEASISHKPFAV